MDVAWCRAGHPATARCGRSRTHRRACSTLGARRSPSQCSVAHGRCSPALLQADAARAAGIATGARDRHGRRTRCHLGRSGVARTDGRCSNRARRVRPPLSSPSRSMRPRGCRLGRIIGSVLPSERASTQTNKQAEAPRVLVQLRRAARLRAVARAARVDRRGCARRVHARRLRAAIPHAAVRRCMHQACARAGAARRRRGWGRRRREGVEFEARRAAAEKVGAPSARAGIVRACRRRPSRQRQSRAAAAHACTLWRTRAAPV